MEKIQEKGAIKSSNIFYTVRFLTLASTKMAGNRTANSQNLKKCYQTIRNDLLNHK